MTSLGRWAGLFTCAATAAFAMAGPALGIDTTIPCNTPPDKGAFVAVHSGTQVSKTQDRQAGTCTFSINGAVSTSPPAEFVTSALNLFRDKSKVYLKDRDISTGAVAALLAAPSPVQQVPDDMLATLKDQATRLNKCLDVFFGYNDLPTEKSEDGKFSCRGLQPYKDSASKTETMRMGQAAVDVPTLEISLQWGRGRFTSVLYLPASMVGMPPLK